MASSGMMESFRNALVQLISTKRNAKERIGKLSDAIQFVQLENSLRNTIFFFFFFCLNELCTRTFDFVQFVPSGGNLSANYPCRMKIRSRAKKKKKKKKGMKKIPLHEHRTRN